MYQSLIVVDDFYDDPLAVRGLALSSAYPEVEGPRTFPGRNSAASFLPPGLEQVASRLVGEPLRAPASPGAFHGRFRLTLAGEEGRYRVHVDPTGLVWVGVVYLSLPEHCQGGTAFYRHRQLASDRTPIEPAELAACGVASVAELLQRDANEPAKWQHLMTVPMRFNRLILYRPWLWHSAAEGFGDSLETGRLIQVLSFAPAAPAGPRQSRSSVRPS